MSKIWIWDGKKGPTTAKSPAPAGSGSGHDKAGIWGTCGKPVVPVPSKPVPVLVTSKLLKSQGRFPSIYVKVVRYVRPDIEVKVPLLSITKTNVFLDIAGKSP